MDVKTICLGILNYGPSSGYEIRKCVEEGSFSFAAEAGFGSIYPALRQMRDDGLIAEAEPAEGDRADKKLYRLTASGEEALRRRLMVKPEPDKFRSDFVFLMAFAHLLPPAHVERLIDDQIRFHENYVEELNKYQTECCRENERAIVELGLMIHQGSISFLKGNRHRLAARALDKPGADPAGDALADVAE
jgi:DNA-binding PadR family transcriptional regulator